MAKSRFIKNKDDAAKALNIQSQNRNAISKIERDNTLYVDAPIRPTNPHALFDEKTVFQNEGQGSADDKQETQTVSYPGASNLPTEILNRYPLSSGAISGAKIVLFSDPFNETTVWENNKRTDKEVEDTSDIDESILLNGMNSIPAIARMIDGKPQVVDGKRRRASCIKNHKPLLALVVEKMSDDDAKVVTVLGNEGRKDAHIFSKVAGYQLLLEGDRPICKSKAELARRVNQKREWISQLMTITQFPETLQNCISIKDLEKLGAKQAIKLTKNFLSLSPSTQESIIRWAESAHEVSVSEVEEHIQGERKSTPKDKSKLGTMNILSKFDNITVVKNKSAAGLFVSLPDNVDITNLDEDEIKHILAETVKNIK